MKNSTMALLCDMYSNEYRRDMYYLQMYSYTPSRCAMIAYVVLQTIMRERSGLEQFDLMLREWLQAAHGHCQ